MLLNVSKSSHLLQTSIKSFLSEVTKNFQTQDVYKVVSRAFSFGCLIESEVRIAFNGDSIPTKIFCDENSNINNEALIECYFSGATLILQGANRYVKKIEWLRSKLETTLDSHVHVNAYLTPANSLGVGFHRDKYNVFIYQLYGKKEWQLRLDKKTIATSYFIQEGMWEYIPLSTEHSTKTNEDPSLHLTFGISCKDTESLLPVVTESKQLEKDSPIELYNALSKAPNLDILFSKLTKLIDLKAWIVSVDHLRVTHPELYKFFATTPRNKIKYLLESEHFKTQWKIRIMYLFLRLEPQFFAQFLSQVYPKS